MESVQKQLEELGLSPNEAKTYLASLELGSATAQQIAAKAAVVRPTAYVAIGGLTKRGLMSSYTKGKKQYFQAEKPDQLLRLIAEEKKNLVEREEQLKSFLPALDAIFRIADQQPDVKFFEGYDGLDAMRKVVFAVKATNMRVMASFDDLSELIKRTEWSKEHNKNLVNKRVHGRTIYTKREAPFPTAKNTAGVWSFKRVDENKILLRGEMTIFGDFVSFVSCDSRVIGVLVKNKNIADMLSSIFDALWNKH